MSIYINVVIHLEIQVHSSRERNLVGKEITLYM